jgi:hypothetical protein
VQLDRLAVDKGYRGSATLNRRAVNRDLAALSGMAERA